MLKLADRIASTRMEVRCFDDAAQENSISDFYSRILSKAQVRSIMYVAIRVGDEVTAAFALSTTRAIRHWSESDIALAKAVAESNRHRDSPGRALSKRRSVLRKENYWSTV